MSRTISHGKLACSSRSRTGSFNVSKLQEQIEPFEKVLTQASKNCGYSKNRNKKIPDGLIRSGLVPKTVNDIFTVVRGVWEDAFDDGVLGRLPNPLDKISNLKIGSASSDIANPFTREELERIATTVTHRIQEVHMAMFVSWAGLSVSEYIALAWENIDTQSWDSLQKPESVPPHVRFTTVEQLYTPIR